eukprot:TRINITY_DN11005_c0_g1_i1.p1 TRINITY_DN11005_c0_g1~~TRINITY_DN11005_c0_g1_i1.p1  ORF type:complete len:173 (-),score=33.52 TRINITY_DN11005_c0_g1_i1:178-696(-)
MGDIVEAYYDLNKATGDVDFWPCHKLLQLILKNIKINPNNPRYRSISIKSKKFSKDVWSIPAAKTLLYAIGFVLNDQSITLPNMENNEDLTMVDTILLLLDEADGIRTNVKRQQRANTVTVDEDRERILAAFRDDRINNEGRRATDSVAREIGGGANINRYSDIGVDLNKGG